MKGTKVAISEELLVQLYNLGKKEDKPIAALVDEMLRAEIKRRRLEGGQ